MLPCIVRVSSLASVRHLGASYMHNFSGTKGVLGIRVEKRRRRPCLDQLVADFNTKLDYLAYPAPTRAIGANAKEVLPRAQEPMPLALVDWSASRACAMPT